MIVDLLQIGLALALPVLLILAIAKRRQRDAGRGDGEDSTFDTHEDANGATSAPPAPPSRSLRRPGGRANEATINLGQDRELARTVIAALETQGVRVKLSERRGSGPNGGPAFEIRYRPEDETTVRRELQRAFDID